MFWSNMHCVIKYLVVIFIQEMRTEIILESVFPGEKNTWVIFTILSTWIGPQPFNWFSLLLCKILSSFLKAFTYFF